MVAKCHEIPTERASHRGHLDTTAKDTVSMLRLKELARMMLPRDSTLRALILSEPDELPRQECLVKLDIYIKLLYQEMGDRYDSFRSEPSLRVY